MSNESSDMIMLYQVNKLKKSLCEVAAVIVIVMKEYKNFKIVRMINWMIFLTITPMNFKMLLKFLP